jgi:hypothetical protein
VGLPQPAWNALCTTHQSLARRFEDVGTSVCRRALWCMAGGLRGARQTTARRYVEGPRDPKLGREGPEPGTSLQGDTSDTGRGYRERPPRVRGGGEGAPGDVIEGRAIRRGPSTNLSARAGAGGGLLWRHGQGAPPHHDYERYSHENSTRDRWRVRASCFLMSQYEKTQTSDSRLRLSVAWLCVFISTYDRTTIFWLCTCFSV